MVFGLHFCFDERDASLCIVPAKSPVRAKRTSIKCSGLSVEHGALPYSPGAWRNCNLVGSFR